MEDLKRRVVRGGLAKVAAQGGNFAIRMATLVVMARLLEPSDFGLLGMVTAFTGVLSLFRDFGLSTAAVQRDHLSTAQSSTLFWLNLVVGVVLWALSSGAAPLLSSFYNEPRVQPVTWALAIGFLLNAAGVQHSALLQREMRFIALSVIEVVALLASSVAGIGLAAAGLGHWSLVAWSLLLPAVNTAGVWLASGWVPGRPGRQVGIGAMVHFGGTLTLNSLVIYLAYNLDKVLVGRIWGANGLGIYGRAYQLVTLPSDGLMGAVGTVAFSALARVREEPRLLRSYFLKGYKTLFSLAVPLTIFCFLFAEEIVLTLFGPRWAEAAPIFRLLTPLILIFAIINPTGWLLLSLGMVGRSLRIALVITPLAIAGYVIGLGHGTSGVAAGFSAAMTLWVIPHLYWSVRGTVVAPRDLFAVMRNLLVAGIAATLVTLGERALVGSSLPPLVQLLLGGATLMACYAGILVWLLGEKPFFLDLLATLKGRSQGATATHRKI